MAGPLGSQAGESLMTVSQLEPGLGAGAGASRMAHGHAAICVLMRSPPACCACTGGTAPATGHGHQHPLSLAWLPSVSRAQVAARARPCCLVAATPLPT